MPLCEQRRFTSQDLNQKYVEDDSDSTELYDEEFPFDDDLFLQDPMSLDGLENQHQCELSIASQSEIDELSFREVFGLNIDYALNAMSCLDT